MAHGPASFALGRQLNPVGLTKVLRTFVPCFEVGRSKSTIPTRAPGSKGGLEIIEEGIRLGYLVIHVPEEGRVQEGSGQAGVVWFAPCEYDVCQPHSFVRRVVAAACPDIADSHAWFQLKKACDLTGLLSAMCCAWTK